MANLTAESIDQLHTEIMQLWSGTHIETPITSTQLRGLIVLIDDGLEGAETTIVQGLPAGPEKTWLLANQPIGRWLMEETEHKRRTDL